MHSSARLSRKPSLRDINKGSSGGVQAAVVRTALPEQLFHCLLDLLLPSLFILVSCNQIMSVCLSSLSLSVSILVLNISDRLLIYQCLNLFVK